MQMTLSLGDLQMIIAIILIFSRGSLANFAARPGPDLRMRRQVDAIMKHLGLPEPAMSRPGAPSPQVLALLEAGDRFEAIKRIVRRRAPASGRRRRPSSAVRLRP